MNHALLTPLAAVALLAGCGGGGTDQATSSSTTPTGDAEQSAAFQDSRALCRTGGIEKVARAYGGGDDPAAVAVAYARASYTSNRDQVAAMQGCFAGLQP